MITHFHGVDKHSTHLTITTIGQGGELISRIARCESFESFIDTLSEKDAVAIEAGNMSFTLADRMEARGARVYIVDPRVFKIITSSTKKTDKNDSIVLAFSLRNHLTGDSLAALPTVFKPRKEIRELRRMFSGHETLKKSMIQLKNTIIGMIRDTGLRIANETKKLLFHPVKGLDALNGLDLALSDYQVIRVLLLSLHTLLRQKDELKEKIIQYGCLFQKDVELLMSIHGVSPFLALAFLADIGGDLSRFRTIRQLNSYLGLVPVTRSSGKREFQGHIIRASRHLTRTLFTQAVQFIGVSSRDIAIWYQQVRERRGIGRGRIALVRKIVQIMRRMLLEQKKYRWTNQTSYQKKLDLFHRLLEKKEGDLRKTA